MEKTCVTGYIGVAMVGVSTSTARFNTTQAIEFREIYGVRTAFRVAFRCFRPLDRCDWKPSR